MKNLKMFAIAVMAFAVMAMGVHAEEAQNVSMAKDGVTYKYESIKKAIEAMDDATEATIIVLKDYDENLSDSDLTITKKITLDLAGHTVTVKTNSIVVKKGTLTITGAEKSKLVNEEGATKTLIKVTGKNSHLTIDKNVTVESDATNNAAYAVALFAEDGSAAKSTIVINGTLKASKATALGIEGRIKKEENPATVTVADGATITSEDALGIYQAGYAKTTVGAATIEGSTGVGVKGGSIALNGTTVTASGKTIGTRNDLTGGINALGAAVQVESGANYEGNAEVTLNGGAYTAKKANAFIINNFKSETPALAESSKISGNAKLVSTDEDGEALPGIAVYVANSSDTKAVLTSLEGLVGTASFNGDVVAAGVVSTNGELDVETLKAALTKGANVTTDDEGNTTVGDQTPGDQTATTPEDQNNQGPTDNVKNPETNDNILVYAGLGLVSLASVAFTAKKRED